ncbi:MAG: PEP-CTERM sorting domain-containing protein [Acidobacteria bacterium]|nr:PEP-CTERM sorting domain-containing protein [Acidobacteriota bacterium]
MAGLIFEGGESHDFYLAGLDLGANAFGFLDNFAWSSLALGEGEELHFFDGSLDTAGAALYLGWLYPLDLDDVFSDFNIYYDSTLPGNSWLAENRYQLNGIGWLIPTGAIRPPGDIPEPTTLLFFGSGLLGFFIVKKRIRAIRG